MTTQTAANSSAEKTFRNVSEAIRVLRSGKKDERWYAAAEFLISRATPEVKLMLDVGKALGKKSEQQKISEKKTVPWKWVLIAFVLVASAVGIGYILARLIGGICGT